MRTAELTLPGFHQDIGPAIYPLGANSLSFKTLLLDPFGLAFITPPWLMLTYSTAGLSFLSITD